MANKQRLRFGFALVLAGTGMGAAGTAGCGDDNGVAPIGDASPDMTQPETGSGSETGSSSGSDTGSPGMDSMAPTALAHIYVVHGSETAPALRFCYGLAQQADGGGVSVVTSFNAAPDTLQAPLPYPGLFPGTGGLLDDHGADLSTRNIAVFAIDASKIATDIGGEGGTERNCGDLIGADGLGSADGGVGALALGTDFWPIGIIPAGTLLTGTSWLFAITGCPAGAPTAAIPFCGMGYDPGQGNLGLVSMKLDSKTLAPPTAMGAQFAQASYQWDVVKSQVAAQVHASSLSTAGAFYVLPEPTEAGSPGGDSGTDASSGGVDSGSNDANALAEAGDDAATDAAVADATVEAGSDAAGAPDAVAETGADAGGPAPVTKLVAFGVGFGQVGPKVVAPIDGLTFDGTSGFAASLVNLVTPVGPPAAMPLPVIRQLTYGSPTAGVPFQNGSSFVFILVGNPLQPTFINPLDGGAATSTTGIFNGRSAHFLAFPTYNP